MTDIELPPALPDRFVAGEGMTGFTPAGQTPPKVHASYFKAAVPEGLDYDDVESDLRDRLKDAFISYLSSAGSVTSYRNAARRALVEDIYSAFYAGFAEAAGDGSETTDEDEKAISTILNQQLDHMLNAFASLKEQRKDPDSLKESEVDDRVDDWAHMLFGVYGEGKLRGDRNKMLTFDGDDGTESCDECQEYKGQRHSAAWWLTRDLVRRNGNEHFGCGRWKPCQHNLYDDDGKLYA